MTQKLSDTMRDLAVRVVFAYLIMAPTNHGLSCCIAGRSQRDDVYWTQIQLRAFDHTV